MKTHTTKNYRTLKTRIEQEAKHTQGNQGKFAFDKVVSEIMQAVLVYDWSTRN